MLDDIVVGTKYRVSKYKSRQVCFQKSNPHGGWIFCTLSYEHRTYIGYRSPPIPKQYATFVFSGVYFKNALLKRATITIVITLSGTSNQTNTRSSTITWCHWARSYDRDFSLDSDKLLWRLLTVFDLAHIEKTTFCHKCCCSIE